MNWGINTINPSAAFVIDITPHISAPETPEQKAAKERKEQRIRAYNRRQRTIRMGIKSLAVVVELGGFFALIILVAIVTPQTATLTGLFLGWIAYMTHRMVCWKIDDAWPDAQWWDRRFDEPKQLEP